jgi:hypothetical protein
VPRFLAPPTLVKGKESLSLLNAFSIDKNKISDYERKWIKSCYCTESIQ